MMQVATQDNSLQEVEERYRDNFARHLLGVALYLQSEIMEILTRQCGHRELRINYEPYISIIGRDGARLSDIAELLGISRQAASQTANQIEAAGYIERRADPHDRRAKLLVATDLGKKLRKEGAELAARTQSEMQQIVGAPALRGAMQTLLRLSEKMDLLLPRGGDTGYEQDGLLAALLPRLRDYVNARLMELTIARGHPGLKLSFGQVLTAIGPTGGRIQQMADAQGVSKQAIGAVATELEELGYIRRVTDSRDARQVTLHFTGRGRHLIADSVGSVDELAEEFSALVGEEALASLGSTLRELYCALHLEEDIFGNTAPVDIRVLARQLTQQLGEEGARALGQLLLCADKT